MFVIHWRSNNRFNAILWSCKNTVLAGLQPGTNEGQTGGPISLMLLSNSKECRPYDVKSSGSAGVH
jgi:hypothetical protein